MLYIDYLVYLFVEQNKTMSHKIFKYWWKKIGIFEYRLNWVKDCETGQTPMNTHLVNDFETVAKHIWSRYALRKTLQKTTICISYTIRAQMQMHQLTMTERHREHRDNSIKKQDNITKYMYRRNKIMKRNQIIGTYYTIISLINRGLAFKRITHTYKQHTHIGNQSTVMLEWHRSFYTSAFWYLKSKFCDAWIASFILYFSILI